MAKITTKIEKEVVQVEYYQLTLSKEEAETLAVVCSLVGGCPTYSPRKHTDSITKALKSKNIFYYNTQARELLNNSNKNNIDFKDY